MRFDPMSSSQAGLPACQRPLSRNHPMLRSMRPSPHGRKPLDSRDVRRCSIGPLPAIGCGQPEGVTSTPKAQRLDGLKVPAAPGSATPIPSRPEGVRLDGTSAVYRGKAAGDRQLSCGQRNAQGWQVVAAHIVPAVRSRRPCRRRRIRRSRRKHQSSPFQRA